jgi:biopolymer transport protein ExbD/biopolymer transport protein TolR
MGGGLGRRKRLMPSADINVTSLVDVAFVLLIIFMITAPMMQGGVQVELPRVRAAPITAGEGITVTVNRLGQIFVDQTRVSLADFRAAFRALVAKKSATDVYIRGDRRAPYGDVVRVLAVIQQSGLKIKVNMTTEDEEVPR